MKMKMMTLCIAVGLTGYALTNTATVINGANKQEQNGFNAAGNRKLFNASERKDFTLADEQKVSLYQGCNHTGWVASFSVGQYTVKQLVAAGAGDDQTSSVTVPEGFKVTLFKNADLTGDSTVLTTNKKCLTDIGFNDNVSSIRVSKK